MGRSLYSVRYSKVPSNSILKVLTRHLSHFTPLKQLFSSNFVLSFLEAI